MDDGAVAGRGPLRVRRASLADVPAIHAVMRCAHVALPDPSLYVLDDLEMVERHVSEEGFTLIAEERDTLLAAQIVRLPGDAPDNLGRELGLGDEALSSVAHLESIAVLPEHQGRALATRLIIAAEEALPAYIAWLACTVSPRNRRSLQVLERCGLRHVGLVARYGGLERLVLAKSVRGGAGGGDRSGVVAPDGSR